MNPNNQKTFAVTLTSALPPDYVTVHTHRVYVHSSGDTVLGTLDRVTDDSDYLMTLADVEKFIRTLRNSRLKYNSKVIELSIRSVD